MKFQSSLISAASGSVGGTTYSRNRFGMYIRNKSNPVNPATARQSAVRGVMTSLVNEWTNTLTPAERLAWGDYGKTTPYTDVFGNAITLTGQMEYIRTNSLVNQSGSASITAAPVIFDRGEAITDIVAFTLTLGALASNWTLGAPASDGGTALLYVGLPQNASRNFYGGPYQHAATATFAAAATSVTINVADVTDPDLWLAASPPVVGQWLPVKVRIVYDDGRVPVEYRAIVEVETV